MANTYFALKLIHVFVIQRNVQYAGRVELNVDTGFFMQFLRKLCEQPVRFRAQVKHRIGAVRLGLRRQYPRRCPRGFAARLAFFDNCNIALAATM